MTAESNHITTVEACGVKVDVCLDNFADVRVMTAMARVSDNTIPNTEKLIWYIRALDVIFGGETYNIQTELAQANGGRLDEETFNAFFKAVMESGQAKN